MLQKKKRESNHKSPVKCPRPHPRIKGLYAGRPSTPLPNIHTMAYPLPMGNYKRSWLLTVSLNSWGAFVTRHRSKRKHSPPMISSEKRNHNRTQPNRSRGKLYAHLFEKLSLTVEVEKMPKKNTKKMRRSRDNIGCFPYSEPKSKAVDNRSTVARSIINYGLSRGQRAKAIHQLNVNKIAGISTNHLN